MRFTDLLPIAALRFLISAIVLVAALPCSALADPPPVPRYLHAVSLRSSCISA